MVANFKNLRLQTVSLHLLNILLIVSVVVIFFW